jgi:peptidoglycan/xylan/chitin deacetylase (PgdA/CDA1 family)
MQRTSLIAVLLCVPALAALLAGCGAPAKAPVEPEPVAVTATPEPPAPPPFKEIQIVSQTNRVPVIMYHDVVERRTRDTVWYDVSKREFQAQMDWIAERGIVPITLDQLYAHLTEGASIPEQAIVLTFDDNYQGFYDHAWPILKEYGFPAAMFVHSGFVEKQQGRPKMSWETLRELVKNPLFTVGGHTVNHPDDLSKLPPERQAKEINDDKSKIEKELGITLKYFAYPNGKYDKQTMELTKQAGYLMAFTISNGLAEESPGILAVHRYIHTRLERAWEQRERSIRGAAAGIFQQPLLDAPVQYLEMEVEGVKLALVTGGRPSSLTSPKRTGVLEFVERAQAVAGINGGFFNMSAIRGTDNGMVGPCKTSDMPILLPDNWSFRWEKLRNRPMMVWGKSAIAIFPWQPETMNSEAAFKAFMPDMTDAFLAGVWLVRAGMPREEEDMNIFSSADIQDPRRRAFIGVMADGSVVLGASKESASSNRLAQAAAAAGVMEAVLLDSGFSTSLVFDGQVKASGHSTPERPSRPVPHAIVVRGEKVPEILATEQPSEEESSRG